LRYTIDFAIKQRFLLIALGIFVLLLFLPINFIVDKEVSWWIRFLLVLASIGLIVATVATGDAIPDEPRELNGWLAPKRVAWLLLGVQVAFGFVTDALGLIEPRGAVERETGLIERAALNAQLIVIDIRKQLTIIKRDSQATRKQTEIIAEALGLDDPQLAQRKIVGIWGEPGCAVTHRITIEKSRPSDKGMLRLQSINPPIGFLQLNTVGRIESIQGKTIKTSTWLPIFSRGGAVEFTYEARSGIETLFWWDKTKPNGLLLERCGR
jgi:hypothetical protein